jgi:hypothetical protein
MLHNYGEYRTEYRILECKRVHSSVFIHLLYNGLLESVRITTKAPLTMANVVCRNILEKRRSETDTFSAYKDGPAK